MTTIILEFVAALVLWLSAAALLALVLWLAWVGLLTWCARRDARRTRRRANVQAEIDELRR